MLLALEPQRALTATQDTSPILATQRALFAQPESSLQIHDLLLVLIATQETMLIRKDQRNVASVPQARLLVHRASRNARPVLRALTAPAKVVELVPHASLVSPNLQ